jgi:2-dehydropantoate 2-reductase
VTDSRGSPRVLVFGAGAVGSLLGGIISSAGYDVTLLGRGPAIETIARNGLAVSLQRRQFHTHPAVITSAEHIDRPFDIILLTVRSFAVDAALASMNALLGKDSILVTFQNGVGTEEIVGPALPGVRHLAGSLTLSADAVGAGIASSSSRSGGVSLAPVSATRTDDTETVARLFEASGIPVSIHPDYRSMKWSKLLLNQMANGIPAILDWTPGDVYRSPHVFRLEQALLRETVKVVSGQGLSLVSLPGFPVRLLSWVLAMPPGIARRLLLSRVEGGRGEKLPSLLLDLRAGRTEIEARWLYGAVADAGNEAGIQAPINRRVHRILDGIAANPAIWQSFRNQPERLARNLTLAGQTSSIER